MHSHGESPRVGTERGDCSLPSRISHLPVPIFSSASGLEYGELSARTPVLYLRESSQTSQDTATDRCARSEPSLFFAHRVTEASSVITDSP